MAKRRTQSIAGIGALAVAVLFGTVVVLGSEPPETIAAAVSHNGLEASVYGEAASSLGPLRLEPMSDAASLGVAPTYEISLDGLPVPRGFVVAMSYDPAALGDIAPNRLSVYVYDRTLGDWASIPSVVDPAARTVTAEAIGADAVWWTLGAR